MKNRITKLTLVILSMLSLPINAQSKGYEKVFEETNVDFLLDYAKKRELEKKANYQLALQIATEKNIPISGEKEGYIYSLVGYDEDHDVLKYIRTFNNVSTASSLQTANAKPLHEEGIKGLGMNVGVWDGGVAPVSHAGFGPGRYLVRDNGNTPSNITLGGRNHAAHVAGTIAANETFSQGNATGFAPQARILAYNYYDDETEMIAAAVNNQYPMVISNHSYGLDADLWFEYGGTASIFGQYNSDARAIDIIANNAPYYTIVFAAGNDRDNYTLYNPSKNGKDLLSQGGVSKNTVVVAATRGTEDFTNITGPTSMTGPNRFITDFSSYGPTDDFRIKPDIAAKGEDVFSLLATNSGASGYMSGTSMAAPAVSGVFTLWQSYYNQLFDVFMRSATVRALMAHSAREAGPAIGPDFMYGWGLIDAAKGKEIIDLVPLELAKIAELTLSQGTTMNYEFEYTGEEPLVVTIAWNDPAGNVSNTNNLNIPNLVNNLDVKVINTDTNEEFFPWALVQSPSISHTSTGIANRVGRNNRDNIEKVEVSSTTPGTYRVIVSHQGNLTGGTQDYSIIISGAGGEMPYLDGVASIEQYALDKIKVYPNPVEQSLFIEGQLDVLYGADVEIFDLSGKRVYYSSDVINNFSPAINVSDLQKGFYILTITKGSAKSSYKFVKK